MYCVVMYCVVMYCVVLDTVGMCCDVLCCVGMCCLILCCVVMQIVHAKLFKSSPPAVLLLYDPEESKDYKLSIKWESSSL